MSKFTPTTTAPISEDIDKLKIWVVLNLGLNRIFRGCCDWLALWCLGLWINHLTLVCTFWQICSYLSWSVSSMWWKWLFNIAYTNFTPPFTETKMSSFWWNLYHWLHRKLSKWQLSVQPVMKLSSKWWHFRFSEIYYRSSHKYFVGGMQKMSQSHLGM